VIDIDRLTESELIDLNHRIVARLRMMHELNAHASMLEFRIGERVTFHPEGQRAVLGIITRYNKKTVSIITDDGRRWTVAPQLLRRAERKPKAAESPELSDYNVVALPRPDHSRK